MTSHHFAICINNESYEASLELRKLYEILPDPAASKMNHLRVVDESGEDYLYPDSFFVPLSLPDEVEQQVVMAA